MPYKVGAKGSYGCSGYPAVKDDGTVMGCHNTAEEAANQIYAINQSEGNIDSKANYSGMDDEEESMKRRERMSKADIKEGDYVMGMTVDGQIHGRVEHVMLEGGTLGEPGTEYALESMPPENPAMSVRVFEEGEDGEWEPTAYSIGMMYKDAKIADINNHTMENENEEMDSEVAMAMYDSSIGKSQEKEDEMEKAKKPNYQDMIKPRRGGSNPADSQLYARVVQAAKDKFDVYPSAVANAWVVQEYKRRGGTYKSESVSTNSVWGGSLFDPKGFLK